MKKPAGHWKIFVSPFRPSYHGLPLSTPIPASTNVMIFVIDFSDNFIIGGHTKAIYIISNFTWNRVVLIENHISKHHFTIFYNLQKMLLYSDTNYTQYIVAFICFWDIFSRSCANHRVFHIDMSQKQIHTTIYLNSNVLS